MSAGIDGKGSARKEGRLGADEQEGSKTIKSEQGAYTMGKKRLEVDHEWMRRYHIEEESWERNKKSRTNQEE